VSMQGAREAGCWEGGEAGGCSRDERRGGRARECNTPQPLAAVPS
jgi:hypothetical protein